MVIKKKKEDALGKACDTYVGEGKCIQDFGGEK
jgi:hypothetical protein